MSKYTSFEVGDRIGAIGDDNQSQNLGTVIDVNKKIITITWKNGLSAEYTPKQMQAYGYQKFLEDEGAIASCYFYTPVSLQESEASTSLLLPPEHLTLLKPNSSSKITPPRNLSLATDSQKLQSTAISLTITPSQENLTSTQLDFLAPALALQATEQDLNTQNQNSGLKPCGASPTVAPVSSSLKILQDLSPEDYEQFLGDSEWLATSGMIRKSYQLRNLDRPKKGKDSLSLPTPTTYCKGSTGCRPAGATRLEQKLRPYITKGDKLNPAVPGWMMGFPVGWAEWPLMDTGETISVQLPFILEYATTSINDEIVTTSTPDQSAPSKQQLQLGESVTSLTLLEQLKRSDVRVDLYIYNSSFLTKLRQCVGGVPPLEGTAVTGGSIPPADFARNAPPGSIPVDTFALNVGKITEVWQTCFTVDWKDEIKCYFWERDEQVISELALAQPAAGIAPQHLIDKFFSQKETLKAIEEKSGYETIHENFLEETEPQPETVQKPKGRQRKGCLYRYIENKKPKNG